MRGSSPAPGPADVAAPQPPPARTSRDRPPAPPAPGARLSAGRALAGAALSVCGVVLGIVTLLWVTDGPTARPELPPQSSARQLPTADPAPTAPVEQAPAPRTAAPAPPPAVVPAPAPVEPPAPPAAAAPAPPPVVVPVTVLNNSRIPGLAARGAAQFRDGGWPVAATGNFRGRLPASTVYFPPGQQAAARAFAERFPAVSRVLPRFAGLPGSGLTVVLTRDFS